MGHNIRPSRLPPEPHWEVEPSPSCDVCGTCTVPLERGAPIPSDDLCDSCRKAVEDAREQRAYLNIDRAILATLKDGPITGTQLVSRFRGHWGIGRIHNVSIEAFNAHLEGLLRSGTIRCTKVGDPEAGWSIVAVPV